MALLSTYDPFESSREEETFQKASLTTRGRILKEATVTQKLVFGLMRDCKKESLQYLEVWSQLIIKCKNASFRFLDNLETVIPKLSSAIQGCSEIQIDEHIDKQKTQDKTVLTWALLHKALSLVENTAIRSFDFYRQAVRMVSVEEAVRRIEAQYGNLTVFAEAVLTAWYEMDLVDTLQYSLAFLGPVGLATGISFLLGLSFTGIGLFVIMGGLALGGLAVSQVSRWKKSQRNKARQRLDEAKQEAQLFFQRWDSLNVQLSPGEILQGMEYLTRTNALFEHVCVKVFPEVTCTLELSSQCSICLYPLIPRNLFRYLDKKAVEVPRNYVADRRDIVFQSQCPKHLFHQGCLSQWRSPFPTSPRFFKGCPMCRKTSPTLGIAFIYTQAKTRQILQKKEHRRSSVPLVSLPWSISPSRDREDEENEEKKVSSTYPPYPPYGYRQMNGRSNSHLGSLSSEIENYEIQVQPERETKSFENGTRGRHEAHEVHEPEKYAMDDTQSNYFTLSQNHDLQTIFSDD